MIPHRFTEPPGKTLRALCLLGVGAVVCAWLAWIVARAVLPVSAGGAALIVAGVLAVFALPTVGVLSGFHAILVYPGGMVEFHGLLRRRRLPATDIRAVRRVMNGHQDAIRFDCRKEAVLLPMTFFDAPQAAIERFDEFLALLKQMNPAIQLGEFPVRRLYRDPAPPAALGETVPTTIYVRPAPNPAEEAKLPSVTPGEPVSHPPLYCFTPVPLLLTLVASMAIPLLLAVGMFAEVVRANSTIAAGVGIAAVFIFVGACAYCATIVVAVELRRGLLTFRRFFGAATLDVTMLTVIASSSSMVEFHHEGGCIRVPRGLIHLKELVAMAQELKPGLTLEMM